MTSAAGEELRTTQADLNDADEAPRAPLTAAAQRALAEAAERRAARDAAAVARATEIGGPAGPDPVRYGDWEKGGIAWDF